MMEIKGDVSNKTRSLIGIVVSRFHKDITDRLLKSALDELHKNGIVDEQIIVFHVPGSWEIPYGARLAAREGSVDGIICLGALIKGETAHFDIISREMARGLTLVEETFDIPITFGVLTCSNKEQALARAGGEKGDMGREAASALLELISITEQAWEKLSLTEEGELDEIEDGLLEKELAEEELFDDDDE